MYTMNTTIKVNLLRVIFCFIIWGLVVHMSIFLYIKSEYFTSSLSMRDSISREKRALSYVAFDPVEKNPKEKLDLLVLITSHPKSKIRRSSIRSLWGSRTRWKTKNWRLVFVCGHLTNNTIVTHSLCDEARLHKDILLVNVTENFYLLAQKVVVSFTWAKHNFNFRALIKCDDDVFVNVDNAVRLVDEEQHHVMGGYYGYCHYGATVDRDGRYGVLAEEYAQKTFPDYCSGGGFILTNKSFQSIVPRFDFEKIWRIDDAYIGGVAALTGIRAVHSQQFYMKNAWCEFRLNMIVNHPTKEESCMRFLTERAVLAAKFTLTKENKKLLESNRTLLGLDFI